MIAAAVQMTCTSDAAANFAQAERLIRKAAARGAQLVVTPENTNYLGPHAEKVRLAEPVDGPTITRFADLARDIGLLIVELGGGRRQASDTIDPRVGFTQFAQLGQQVQAGEPLAVVHAADTASAEHAQQVLQALIQIGDAPMALAPVLVQRVVASATVSS